MERWSSRIGFIMAAIGSAVGIGNIWRFPAVVGQNGGGAYLIPYLLACFLVAVPLMILELTVGRTLRADVVSAYARVRPYFRPVGWLVALVVLILLSYYLVITGWTLAYTGFALVNRMELFTDFTTTYQPVVSFLVAALLTGVIVALGVRNGIERLSVISIPFILVILCVMAVFVTTLPGFVPGISFYLTPDFTVLLDPLIWSAAFGQAFFSLSVGMGVLITYGAYLDRNVNVARSSLVITIADLTVSLLAGFVIFPIVFSFGLDPGTGAQLTFNSLPKAFALLPQGHLIGFAFFTLLFLAALTSAIAMFEVNAAAWMEAFSWSRHRVTLLLTGIVVIAGLPAALSYSRTRLSIAGFPVLDLVDDTLGTLGIPIAALLTSVTFSWFMERSILENELDAHTGFRRMIIPACRYLIPAVLIISIIARLSSSPAFTGWQLFPGAHQISGPVLGIALLIIMGVLLIGIMVACRMRQCRLFLAVHTFMTKKLP